MKIRQLVIFGIFLLISALIFFRLASSKKHEKSQKKSKSEVVYVSYQTVRNIERSFQLKAYGQVNPTVSIDISFEVQGKLEYGRKKLRPGMHVNKGELLYQVNNEEAFYNLSARKTQLLNLLISVMPDVEIDFNSETSKWKNFMNSIRVNELLPDFPAFRSNKEKMFFTSRGIISEYYNIRGMEARMEKYLYLAPFSGTITDIYTEPGSLAGPGVRVARLVKTGDFEVKVPIGMEHLKTFQQENKAIFYQANGEAIAEGNILRVSDVINQQTQSIDVYYNIRPYKDKKLYNGQFLDAVISQKGQMKSMTLPITAVQQGKVQVLKKDSSLVLTRIQVLENVPDSIRVGGLADHDQVVLEFQELKSNQKAIGIKR